METVNAVSVAAPEEIAFIDAVFELHQWTGSEGIDNPSVSAERSTYDDTLKRWSLRDDGGRLIARIGYPPGASVIGVL